MRGPPCTVSAATPVVRGDGVEVHGANTYLLEQFLRDTINDRKGPYGGSIANRARLTLEVMQAAAKAIGAGRTGIRLSPMTTFGNTAPRDSHPQALYNHVVEQLAPLGLAYVHVIEGETGGAPEPADAGEPFDYAALRSRFPGAWMVNNGYSRADALDAIASGRADLVAFGRSFISNPDLVRRLRENLPLNEPRSDRFYGEEVEKILQKESLSYLRKRTLSLEGGRSDQGRPDVILLDTMGELMGIYSLGTLVFVGGSLFPIGGHNPLGPLFFRKCVFFGPYMFNFFEISSRLVEAGGAIQVSGKEELFSQWKRVLFDEGACNEVGERGYQFLQRHQAATERVFEEIRPFLSKAQSV